MIHCPFSLVSQFTIIGQTFPSRSGFSFKTRRYIAVVVIFGGDFVSIVAEKKWQQCRQNQDVYNLPYQGLTPLAVVLRPVRAWCNPKTWCMILIRNGRWDFDLHLGVICNYTFISIAMNFRKVMLKGHLQWPITNHLRKSYLC